MEKLLEFKDAKMGYKKATVLENVSVTIHRGDFLGLIGSNGAGKTTFLKTFMGLLKVKSGILEKYGDIKFGYCMQRDFLSTIFPFTVMEIVLMMRTSHLGPFKGFSSKDKDIAIKSLKQCGIEHLADTRFYNLSGGQQQRVLIARALALQPDVLVLDEPTIDLDVKGKKEILGLIYTFYQEHKMTVLLVSHELNQVINHAEKFLFFVNSRCFGVYSEEELSGKLLSEIFGTEIQLHQINGKKAVL